LPLHTVRRSSKSGGVVHQFPNFIPATHAVSHKFKPSSKKGTIWHAWFLSQHKNTDYYCGAGIINSYRYIRVEMKTPFLISQNEKLRKLSRKRKCLRKLLQLFVSFFRKKRKYLFAKIRKRTFSFQLFNPTVY
jgi:hypothetical protein